MNRIFTMKIKIRNILVILFSILLLSCDPDQISSPPIANKIENDCKDNGIQLQSLKNKSGNNQLVTYKDEPKFTEQWYLNGSNKMGLDINILALWQKGYGTKPISIAVLDQGIDTSHPDLRDSILLPGFGGYNPKLSHGTRVAGIIAARDNNMGIIGLVPHAKLYSYAIFDLNTTNEQIGKQLVKALNDCRHKQIAVYNASFGYENAEASYHRLHLERKQAIDSVTRQGFYNKGSSIVFAAGNGKLVARNDGYVNHYAVIAVNAINSNGTVPSLDDESTFFDNYTNGVNLWLTAPAGFITTDNSRGYTEKIKKTSSAAPLVSGAIALIRSEYPELTWRDIKLILAESAKKYDKNNQAQYTESGCLYSDPSKKQQYSKAMGFGLLDVAKAFTLAQSWQLLPTMKTEVYTDKNRNIVNELEYNYEFTVKDSISFIESITLDVRSKPNGNWKFSITSPNNSKAEIKMFHTTGNISLLFNNFLGSPTVGKWKVMITANQHSKIEELKELKITFRGH